MKKGIIWLAIAAFLLWCAGESLYKTREANREAEKAKAAAEPPEARA